MGAYASKHPTAMVDEFCDWGLCKTCVSGCLGMLCKLAMEGKTDHCKTFGKCDYPGKPSKRLMRPEDVVERRAPGHFGSRCQI